MSISAVEATMSSVQGLKEVMRRRLTAACEEIFTVFAQTIVQYEEEIQRQRKQLENIRKSDTALQKTDLPQQHASKETEVPVDQEAPVPLQIKEEQEEVLLVLKQEPDTFMVTLNYEGSDCSKSKPMSDQLLSHGSPAAESRDQGGSMHVDSGLTRNPEPKMTHLRNRSRSNMVDNVFIPWSHCNTDTGAQSVRFESQMKEPNRMPRDEKWYHCETCGKIFNQSCKLTIHMRTHTGERPYPCTTCGKRFKDLSTFRKHKAIHTGEKTYSCQVCAKSFTQSGGLTVHMRTHTNERPYACDMCGKAFKGAAALKYHIRSHTGERPYPCKTCGIKFRDLSAFRNHTAIHTGEKRFSCKICRKSFTQSSTLRVHMKTHKGEAQQNLSSGGL